MVTARVHHKCNNLINEIMMELNWECCLEPKIIIFHTCSVSIKETQILIHFTYECMNATS